MVKISVEKIHLAAQRWGE